MCAVCIVLAIIVVCEREGVTQWKTNLPLFKVQTFFFLSRKTIRRLHEKQTNNENKYFDTKRIHFGNTGKLMPEYWVRKYMCILWMAVPVPDRSRTDQIKMPNCMFVWNEWFLCLCREVATCEMWTYSLWVIAFSSVHHSILAAFFGLFDFGHSDSH